MDYTKYKRPQHGGLNLRFSSMRLEPQAKRPVGRAGLKSRIPDILCYGIDNFTGTDPQPSQTALNLQVVEQNTPRLKREIAPTSV